MGATINELNGSRVTLAALEPQHIDELAKGANYPAIWSYMPVHATTRSDIERIVQIALEENAMGSRCPFVVIDRESRSIVGSTSLLDISPVHRSLEIGWTWLLPQFWRTSINTECKYLLLRHCFESAGLVRVQLKTDLRNTRSQIAIERIGGVKEGVLRHNRIQPDGYLRDSVYYSILDSEWPDVKRRLERRLGSPAVDISPKNSVNSAHD